MKQIIFSTLGILLLICSCVSSKERSLQRLENLVTDVKTNYQQYDAEDWENFMHEYQVTDSLLSLENYSKEEYERIGQLKGELTVYVLKGGASHLKQKYNNRLKEASGVAKGFLDALSGNSEE